MTYVSISTVATRFAVKQQTVLGWIKNGDLQAVNVGRTTTAQRPRWRISEDALDQFLAARQPQAPPQRPARRARHDADVIQFFS